MILFISFSLVIFNSGIISADDSSEEDKIDKAYDWLNEKIDEKKCESLSTEEKIFSLLAIGECKNELKEDSKDDECWPKNSCDLKTTAQSIMALDKKSSNTDDAKDWLLSKKTSPSEIIWYLQIESPQKTNCKISYSGSEYSLDINENKKLSSGAGTCLSLTPNSYWLEISSNCYNNEFTISCDYQFLTNLLFKKETSSTIHVLQETHSSSEDGTTKETINFSCFSLGTDCDYEGSLWAALALSQIDESILEYLPYLISTTDENKEFMPESFLYLLTGYSDFRNDLLLKQKNNQYWDESGNNLYDTAIALYPFQYEESTEKSNSISWLLEIQKENGCWRDNLRDTAFLLYSIWPREINNGGGGSSSGGSSSGGGSITLDCEDTGYYCMSAMSCEGNILSEYSCTGSYKCCDTALEEETCLEQGGEICNSNQECIGGIIIDASNTESGQICCYEGSCEEPYGESECEEYGGVCRTSCFDDEEDGYRYCEISSDTCCIEKTPEPGGKSYFWIWILIILIILVVIAIIFRNKLRPYWFRLISKFKKSPPGKPGYPRNIPRPVFAPPHNKMLRPTRRIIHPPQKFARHPAPKRKGEIDDVLKKLKDMGK